MPVALGMYLYAGGFAVGIRRAGFDVVAHLEGDNAYGVSTARLNWPDLPIHHGPAKWPLGDLRNLDIDLAFANPPCAIFSSQGIVTTRGPDSWRDDERLDHWWDCFRVLEEVNPRVWALESVTQAYSRGRPLIDEMTKKALVRGYSVSHILLDAKWTGVPQSRRRFFIIAHRPQKLIGYQHNWSPPPTVGEVLAEVSEPGWTWDLPDHLQRMLELSKPGELLSDVWDRETENKEQFRTPRGLKGRPSFRHKRLDASRQMGAFVSGDNYHPTENRNTGINEWKALCGYPQEFILAEPRRDWPHLLARAVLPPVGFWLGRALVATLNQDDARWEDRRVTLIDVREPDRPELDLTNEYLDSSGRVRLRARADGSIQWSGLSSHEVARDHMKARVGTVRPEPSLKTLPAPVGGLALLSGRWVDGEVERIAPSPRSLSGQSLGTVTGGPPTIDRLALGNGPEHPAGAKAERTEMNLPRPSDGEGSGRFIQRLWKTTELSVDEILVAVHAAYTGRTTARGDVYYNYKKLVDAGENVRPWSNEKRGRKNAQGQTGSRSYHEPTDFQVEVSPALPTDSSAVGLLEPRDPKDQQRAVRQEEQPLSYADVGLAIAERYPNTMAELARSEPQPKIGSDYHRVAVIDWYPRVCGATDSGAHLAFGDDRYELVTASLSGRPLAAWNTPWSWKVLPLREVAAQINRDYDAVVLTDIACLAPEMTERDHAPFYAGELAKITVPMTAIFHGGMAYKPGYDHVIENLVRSPGFTGSILTAREGQARERLAKWPVRYVVNPFYAYREDRAAGARRSLRDRKRAVMMTQRLASNKGQNALLAMMSELQYDAEIWGYNSFGLPSIGWRLYELGQALGYQADGPPELRGDASKLTHPNAPKFYTGKFAFTAANGQRFTYHDGYSKLTDVDWSPWVHLSMFSPDFHGLLEFAILDAVHSGTIAVVPEGTVPRDWYDDTLITIPFDGSTLWVKKDSNVVTGRDFDRPAVARIINELLRQPVEKLLRIANNQYDAVRARHDPAVYRKSVEAALRGEGEP